MNKRKVVQHIVVFITLVVLFVSAGYKSNVYAASAGGVGLLKIGSRGSEVVELQKRLKELGLFKVNITGYFGNITRSAVISFQKKSGITVDGIVGNQTRKYLYPTNSANTGISTQVSISRGDYDREDILLPWFGVAENIFSIGTKAVVTDIDTGISFNVERTYGYNHADTETLTKKDTELMKKIFRGQWSWERRAVIVTVGNRKIAASIAGMPHAGRDDKPANVTVSGRSDGYGTGDNLDTIKGNGMDGHFDIHFLGSRTHGTNRVDEQHQAMVQKAARSYRSSIK